MFQRELQLEERCALMNLKKDEKLTGRTNRYSPTTTKTVSQYADRTVAQIHDYLDGEDVPRFTNNPHPLNEIEDFLGGKCSLNAVLIRHNLSFESTTHTMLEVLLDMALKGELTKTDDAVVVKQVANEHSTAIQEATGADTSPREYALHFCDFLIQRPKDKAIYAYWLNVKEAEQDVPDND
jgi:hypothetical protein